MYVRGKSGRDLHVTISRFGGVLGVGPSVGRMCLRLNVYCHGLVRISRCLRGFSGLVRFGSSFSRRRLFRLGLSGLGFVIVGGEFRRTVPLTCRLSCARPRGRVTKTLLARLLVGVNNRRTRRGFLGTRRHLSRCFTRTGRLFNDFRGVGGRNGSAGGVVVRTVSLFFGVVGGSGTTRTCGGCSLNLLTLVRRRPGGTVKPFFETCTCCMRGSRGMFFRTLGRSCG